MNITRFSIKRPIGICMIYILICVLGLISFFRIGVELLPDVDSKFISVIVNYPGASTESVEQQVTKPIEDELSSISHFKHSTAAINIHISYACRLLQPLLEAAVCQRKNIIQIILGGSRNLDNRIFLRRAL